jgi:fatty-acyl-CoA synthase
VPINFMLNADEVAFILRSSGAKVLAVGADFVELGRSAATRDTRIERIYWLPGEEPAAKPAGQRGFDNLLANDDAAPAIALDARMLAQIVYTSGTESLPKGAMLTRGSM